MTPLTRPLATLSRRERALKDHASIETFRAFSRREKVAEGRMRGGIRSR
jgi:hypothetical protein